jgi:exodeoxyribonuclease V alpha subunit
VLRDIVLESLDESIDGRIDYASIDNQIISCQNTSWIGTVKLNAMLQMIYHDRMEPCVQVPRYSYGKDHDKEKTIPMFVGDKVIITRNMYDLDVFNGESGKIIEFSSDGEIIIDFGDKEQAIPPVLLVQNRYGNMMQVDPRKDVDLGYVITTHKSQGSEYQNGIYVINKSTGYMQNRRNFYTACSRFKQRAILITDQQSLRSSLYKQG